MHYLLEETQASKLGAEGFTLRHSQHRKRQLRKVCPSNRRQCGVPPSSASKSSRTSEEEEGVTERGQCGVQALGQAHMNRQKAGGQCVPSRSQQDEWCTAELSSDQQTSELLECEVKARRFLH